MQKLNNLLLNDYKCVYLKIHNLMVMSCLFDKKYHDRDIHFNYRVHRCGIVSLRFVVFTILFSFRRQSLVMKSLVFLFHPPTG